RKLKRAVYTLLLAFGLLLWLAALLLFSRVAEDSDDFARLQVWILIVNSIGVAVLITLIGVHLTRLLRELRRHVPGSRLKLRMITLLVSLAVTPLVIVYLFSVAFVNRGIDNWFDVDVQRGLEDALALSQIALDVEKRNRLEDLERLAARLDRISPASATAELAAFRRESGAEALTLFGANGRVLAASASPDAAAASLAQELMLQLAEERSYVSLEPLPGGAFQVIAAVNVGGEPGGPMILEARFPVESEVSGLANSVQQTADQYSRLDYLRGGLKASFTLTLSLVLLISVLASVYGAFASARRLVRPIQQLMQGTRAVARGDFYTRLPVPARDEIGFLINSFNDMTQRLAEAREQARSSEQKV